MARTALQIVQDAAVKLGLEPPSVLFSGTDRTDMEMRRALQEASDKIVHAHDWQALLTIQTNTGDGSTTEYALPDDYLRMPKDARVRSTKWEYPLCRVEPEDWLSMDIRGYDVASGVWTIYGDNMVHLPALDSDEQAKYWYVSDAVAKPASGANKDAFTEDTDTFRLDDRVLELMLVAQWRMQKGLDYAEELAEAETALARAISRDKGARIISQRSRTRLDAAVAYPVAITP